MTLMQRFKMYEESTKALFEHNPDVVWWMDNHGNILSANTRVEDICGYAKGDFANQPFDRFIHEEELEAAISSFVLARKGKPQNFETAMIHQEGHRLEFNMTFVPVTVDYKIVGVYAIAKDITEKKKYEADLKASNQFISNILDSITDCFFAVDSQWKITYWNAESERVFEKPRKEALGSVLWDMFPEAVETPLFSKLHRTMYERKKVQFEFYDPRYERWYWILSYPSADGISICLNDITGRKQTEQQVVFMTYYDTLTELPNQKLFVERLKLVAHRAKNNRGTLAVMIIDLDRFKMVNDLMGYGQGDRVLVSVAKRLMSCIRESDTASRFEGDVFAVLLQQVNRIQVDQIARRILEEFQKPIMVNQQEFVITPSIGISFYPDDGSSHEELMAHADTAMRRAKDRGKNNFQFFKEEMNDRPFFVLINELRNALDRKELKLLYQPQINIRTGKITGVEALLRWEHPELGTIPPCEFIPIAEETGLITPIGEWAIREACAQNKSWQDAGFEPMVVSVNLSPRQFGQSNLVDTVRTALEETGLAPCYLGLEITESMTIDVSQVIVTLEKLKEIGVTVSLDDFGMGYSSLFYLKSLPINSLKIDGSFVRDYPVNDREGTIVKTMISMAHHLKLNVVAEGVETREQLIFLQQNLCETVQGYLFSKPISAGELEKQQLEIQGLMQQMRSSAIALR